MDLTQISINVLILLLALSVHESAHAWTADRLGDSTARELGRVTLNPVAHIDPVGTVLFPLLGALSGLALFGWAKPVPVNPSRLRHPRRDHVLVAAAGPFSNLLLAALFLLGAQALQASLSILWLGAYMGVLINVVLAVFNLIPIPPLDGSWIAWGLFPRLGPLFRSLQPYGFLILLGLLWMGALNALLRPVLRLVQSWIV